MTQLSGVIVCIAYILGLLFTFLPWGGYTLLALGITNAFVPRWRRYGLTAKIWLIAGIVGFLASLYFQLRTPQPTTNDVSNFVNNQPVNVQGVVSSTPRVTRNQRGQFWLKATRIYTDKLGTKSKKVTGNLYVTVPLLQATGLYPGQAIAVNGVLYKPKASTNPGSFNFKAYLEQEGTFAGLKGREISFADGQKKPQWGWWRLREKIVRSQVSYLSSPTGQLVSSMVLGSKAVDLPYDIRDAFVKVGLAHALAASGFQTSLILGVILAISRKFTVTVQISSAISALIIFLGLSGLQPAVLRAVIMGLAALIALATQRKVKPLSTLLIAATLLLLFNPLWIRDLGFQLSFLATLGLLITVQPIVKRLDWLPIAIATLIAVPLAASLWTLPLQLYVFGVVPVYSLILNILTTPLISIISIGGIISAIAALIWSVAGSIIAWLLYYPTHLLIALVVFFGQLPGNSVAVGKISLLQLVTVYGLMLLVCVQPWLQKRFWLAGAIALTLVLIPVWHNKATLLQATVLATTAEPVIVVQDQGKVLLINNGDVNAVRFTVLPFLQQQGVNKIDAAIAINNHDYTGWLELLKHLPVRTFYTPATSETSINPQVRQAIKARHSKFQYLKNGENIVTNLTTFRLLDTQTSIWQVKIKDQMWLCVNNLKPNQQKELIPKLPQAQVLSLFGDDALTKDLLTALQPKVVIVSAETVDHQTMSLINQSKTQLFWTGRDGAIQWTPQRKFETTVDVQENAV